MLLNSRRYAGYADERGTFQNETPFFMSSLVL